MELKSNNFTSVGYHNIFDFKLTKEELFKWQYKNKKEKVSGVKNKGRLQREKYSRAKLIIAKEAARIVSRIPTVKFVGITGALAMNNADLNSDIDLMVITKANNLWTTRFFVYVLLWIFGYETRKPGDSAEKDRLCINLWLDESDLSWNKRDRNLYTAHEIAQVVPLINKNSIYQNFLWKNKWILEHWPNAVSIKECKEKRTLNKGESFIERIAFKLQYLYMRKKITREVVTPTRAIFHPNDWGKVVFRKLTS